jgi:hypothetical protein
MRHERAEGVPPYGTISIGEAGWLASTVRAEARETLRGRSRSTDVAVLDVYCDLVEEHLSHTVFCPQRDMQVRAGIGDRSTVAKAQARLIEAGFLHFVGITERLSLRYTVKTLGTELRYAPPLAGKSLDIWRNHPVGLGKNAEAVWTALEDGPASAAGLSISTGVPRRTVFRVLATLTDRGLAAQGVDGLWRRGPIDPAHMGVGGARNLRRHTAEQRAWLDRQAYRHPGDDD